MQKFIFIGIGGICGAILRYLIKGVHIYHYTENVPLDTLLINTAGSLLLALVLTVAYEIWKFDVSIRLGIATGFLGAFTTFSTLCKETVSLIHQGDYFSAISYITVSTMIGLAAAYFGIVLAREFISKLARKDDDKFYEDTTEQSEGGVE